MYNSSKCVYYACTDVQQAPSNALNDGSSDGNIYRFTVCKVTQVPQVTVCVYTCEIAPTRTTGGGGGGGGGKLGGGTAGSRDIDVCC